MSGIQNIIARETTTDRDRERGRLNQHSDVVNRECWLRPTGARRPIAHPRSTTSPQHRDTNVSLTHHFIGLSSVGDIADERHPHTDDDRHSRTTNRRPRRGRRSGGRRTDDGEPVGEALARDPDDTE
jgi:hypothetical protein